MRSSKFVIIETRAYFKSENSCFLNLYSVHAARILELSLEIVTSSQMKNEIPLQLLKDFPSCRKRYNISIFQKRNSLFLSCASWL